MGKKPVVGLVGLCWFGLALSGCKDCDCGKDTRQAVRPTPRKTSWDGDTSSVANRPRSVPDNSTIAGRGGDPARTASQYDLNPNQYDALPPDRPPGGQEAAGMSAGQRTMTQSPMQGEDAAVTRTSQPHDPAPDVVPAQQTGAAPAPVHEVSTPLMNPAMATPAPVSGGASELPVSAAPVSGSSAPAAHSTPAAPPLAIPVPPPGAAVPAMTPAETQTLPTTSTPISQPSATNPATSLPPPPPPVGPEVGSAPKPMESGAPLALPPTVPPPPPFPGK